MQASPRSFSLSTSLLRGGLLLAALAGAANASALTLIHTGSHCRSTGASTETGTGERINDTMGVNPDDYATFICPLVLPLSSMQDSVTVGVSAATNFRHAQSYCVVRSMKLDGTLYHEDSSGFFSTNNTNSKQTDTVSMTVNVIPGLVTSAHLRCRLMSNGTNSNGTNKPKNSIIMYWVTN
jgi:hypothetical protein